MVFDFPIYSAQVPLYLILNKAPLLSQLILSNHGDTGGLAKPVVISTPEKLAEGNSILADKQPSEDIINNSPEAQKVIQEPTNSEEKIVLSPLDKNKKCSVCLAHRPPSAFTRNQWQKPDTRTCKSCPMQRRPTSPLTSPINSPIPLPAPQLELAVDDMALPWL